MSGYVALLRGINVGKTKRIAMADLRALALKLGYARAHTLLNSGNLVLEAERTDPKTIGSELSRAIEKRFGFDVPLVILSQTQLDEVIKQNALAQANRDPARFLVAFVCEGAALGKVRPLLKQSWAPDALHIGSRAAYLWCARGLIESRLAQSFARTAGEAATTRNWATVLKLQAALEQRENAR